jgi:hypothetical protein
MKKIFLMISMLALLFTIIPSILFLAGSIKLAGVKLIMLLATITWFAVTPFWMEKENGKV